MAAPKKRKTLAKRRIAHGNKIKCNLKGFTGFNVKHKVMNCNVCKANYLQSFSCKC